MATERVREGVPITMAFEYPQGLPDSFIVDENLWMIRMLVEQTRPDLEVSADACEVVRMGESKRAHEVVEIRATPRRKVRGRE